MAKLSFTKLGLIKNNSIKILDWNNQKIEIKQYLPIQEKLDLIAKILTIIVDEHVFCNPCKIEIFEAIELLTSYTNINLTEKQSEDIFKIYDLISSSGLLAAIKDLIPADELTYIENGIHDTVKEIYRYRDSAMGIMEQIAQDYKNVNFNLKSLANDIEEIQENSIITKLD